MSEGSELHQSTLRATLYALMELSANLDGSDVIAHLTLNIPDYYANQSQRERVTELSDYLTPYEIDSLSAVLPMAAFRRKLRALRSNRN